ncbi:16103_t:CDS:2 [Gigaspora margarita]|uniref:16103_t:CDS:1 n=1 Tax=Gigaspora margarita TaxID=4874 RepID=A0ABN7V484_GIGMA|nr:16103_t:CDS:2 [Gigaspora margarita]
MPQQQECLQTQKTSSQLTSQHIQIPQQTRYSQQISTNPNMTSPPQTPNVFHAPNSTTNKQWFNDAILESTAANGKAVATCATINAISNMAKMPQQIPQNMLQQTNPSQTNNQFISYGPTQHLVWQQQPNVAMYNL